MSTGLDLFSKVQGGHNYNCIVFYETGYKLNVMRQAARRAWRIGQPRDCYIYYLYYQGTMQHRAMSLMSKKMAAALALEGEFSEEGLAAMAGEGDEQMALAKSMSEKIDDADMQRSWSKVKSLTEKKKPPKKKVALVLADLAADAKPDALDTLEEDAQLLARTILERQQKPVPTSAMPDIISLAERFAKADEGMWGAARAMAFRQEPTAEFIVPATEDTPKGTPVVGKFTVTNGDGNMLIEGENTIVTVGVDDVITLKASIAVDGGAPAKLKVYKPEPTMPPATHAIFEDIEFDDALIAKMMANIAANGLTLADLGG